MKDEAEQISDEKKEAKKEYVRLEKVNNQYMQLNTQVDCLKDSILQSSQGNEKKMSIQALEAEIATKMTDDKS